MEKVIVIILGLLVNALFWSALAATLDWEDIGRRWGRTKKYYRVHWMQLSDADRAFWTWYGRAAWVCVLLVAAL